MRNSLSGKVLVGPETNKQLADSTSLWWQANICEPLNTYKQEP
jgi:hypothetical protein